MKNIDEIRKADYDPWFFVGPLLKTAIITIWALLMVGCQGMLQQQSRLPPRNFDLDISQSQAIVDLAEQGIAELPEYNQNSYDNTIMGIHCLSKDQGWTPAEESGQIDLMGENLEGSTRFGPELLEMIRKQSQSKLDRERRGQEIQDAEQVWRRR